MGPSRQDLVEKRILCDRRVFGEGGDRDRTVIQSAGGEPIGKEIEVNARSIRRAGQSQQLEEAPEPYRDLAIEGIGVRQQSIGVDHQLYLSRY